MTSVGKVIEGRPVYSVQRDATVFEAVQCMADRNIGAVPVLDRDRLVGIMSERDVIKRVVVRNLDPRNLRVEQIMTSALVVADASEDEESCLRKMKSANCRHLPVVSGETLLGILSLRDLLEVELGENADKLEFLTGYMFHLRPGPEQSPGT